MKKILNTVAILSLVLSAISFAVTPQDTTIKGQSYAKIESCSDLSELRTWTNQGTVVNAVLMNDINCSNNNFNPIGTSEKFAYNGVFDGNGKTISGMKIKSTSSYTGMFGIIGISAQVKNLTISNSTISNVSTQYAGILVGLNYGVVTNVTVESTCSVQSSGSDVGGVAGRNGGYGTMSGCVNKANVKGDSDVGGIAGACTGAIANSINYGKIEGSGNVGGVVGSIHYRTTAAIGSGKDSTFVPGRVALCQNVGEVVGGSYAGGIAGENKIGTINNCRNDGNVSAGKNKVAGGVVGYTYFDDKDNRYKNGQYNATVSNSFNTGSVEVDGNSAKVGGVVGIIENKCKEYNGWVWKCKSYYNTSINNSYFDNEKLTKVSVIASNSDGIVNSVSGKPTNEMFANDGFVTLLNGNQSYLAWLFDGADYPIINFGADQGNFRVRFMVDGSVKYDATTVNGVLQATVVDPAGAFNGWVDDENNVFTSQEANARIYNRNVDYNAAFKQLFNITFVKSNGDILAVKTFEEGSQIFYSCLDESGLTIECNPENFETEDATFTFTGWDRDFGIATKHETYTAIYTETPKAFDVKFYVQSEMIDSQKVAYGEDAVAPAAEKIPEIEGFRFDGWDTTFTNIIANLDVDAIMTPVVDVCLVVADTTFDCFVSPKDSVIKEEDLPKVPSSDSLTCTAWLNGEVEFTEVEASEIEKLVAKCTVNEFEVKFVALDSLVESQKVLYGMAATAPAEDKIPIFEGLRFTNWIEDFSRIVSDFTINANYIPTVEVCFGVGEFDAEDCKDYDKDSTYEIPELPGDPTDKDGFTCTEWTLNGESFEGTTFTAAEKMEFIAKCHKNEFEVKFYVQSEMIDSQKVAYGEDAVAPAAEKIPEIEGFRFDGWDKVFTNVTENLDVNAIMTAMTTVCKEYNGNVECDTVPADTVIVIPGFEESDSLTCTAWQNGDVTYVPGDEVKASEIEKLVAVCTVNEFEVKFVALDSLVESQKVLYGMAATAPAEDKIPVFEGLRFTNWIEDFSRIVSDFTINANYIPTVEVCFGAGEFDAEDCKDYDKDSTYEIPELPGDLTDKDGFTCTEWTLNGESFEGTTFTAAEKMEFIAKCHKNEFEVKFIVLENTVKTETVAYGADATAPEVSVDGFRFDGWDKVFTNVTENLDVNAIMTAMTIVCKEYNGNVECDTVPADTVIVIPGFEESDSLTCTAWQNGDTTYVPGDEVKASEIEKLVAVCTVNEFEVKFVAFDSLVESQKVSYGMAAVEPADSLVPVFEGYRFRDWDADFTYIITDLVVNAMYDTLVKVVVNADFGKIEIDSTIYVLKDTIITGIDSMKNVFETIAGEGRQCIVTVDNALIETDTLQISKDIDVNVNCDLVTKYVSFYVEDSLLAKNPVIYGFSASYDGEIPEFKNKRFVGWDVDLTYIVEDMDAHAVYVEVDTVFVMVNDKPIDTIVVAKGDSAEYILKPVENTEDSTFLDWNVDGKLQKVGDTVIVKYGSEVFASFEETNAIHAKRLAVGFNVRSENSQIMISGARVGDVMAIFDLQGRVVLKKRVQSPVEMVNIINRGNYLVRVGGQTKRVVVR